MSTYHQPAHHTPTTLVGGTVAPAEPSAASASSSAAVALAMSWQLLVVVVAPIVGGQLLDSRYHTAHVWIIVGMAVGLAGTVIVVRQAMRQLSEIMGQKSQESKK